MARRILLGLSIGSIAVAGAVACGSSGEGDGALPVDVDAAVDATPARPDSSGNPLPARDASADARGDDDDDDDAGVQADADAEADAATDAEAGAPPTTLASALAAGGDEACIITTSGALECWGGLRPRQALGAGETWKHVTTGGIDGPPGRSGCAIRGDDTLWCWEKPGATLDRPAGGVLFQAVRASATNRCAVTVAGALFCWGNNNAFGQLGTGDTAARPTPTQIGTDTDWRVVAPGRDHTCAIKSGGALHCWGWNAFGQLGDTTTSQRTSPVAIDSANTYKDVDTRNVSSCAVRTDGSLLCWGSGLGPQRLAPTAVDAAKDWAKVRVGVGFVCALKTDGSLWCWGANDRGQVALPVTTASLSHVGPQRVGLDADWDDVAAGDAFACAKKKDGTVWCWGSNGTGQLDIDPTAHLTPRRIGGSGEFASAAAGPENVCAVRKNGTLACWGTAGALPERGIGVQTPLTIGSASDWKTAKPGWAGACATKQDDQLHCWSTGAAPAPVGLAVSSYDVGFSHQCAVSSGSLYCWGENIFGKAGAPSGTLNVPAPAKVGTATWSSVAANFDSSCGIQPDGTLWCWGFGVSTGVTKVGNRTTWTAVDRSPGSNGGFYGIAAGALYTWTGAATPILGAIDDDFTAVAAGASHVCGIRSGGTLWCMGANEQGQLGDGTTITRAMPVQIGSATDWASITAGSFFTCGLRTNGDLYCWGTNEYGVMADGAGFRSTLTEALR